MYNTPRALFSRLFFHDLLQTAEIWTIAIKMAAGRQLGFGPTGHNAVQSADLENPLQNMKWKTDDPL